MPHTSAMKPTVSVLIPTFNRGPMLEECLRSVIEQTYSAAQILVIDDGSTDDTAARVAKFAPSVQYLRKDNGGKARALNFAMPHITGEYLWLFDDDDVALPESIEMRVRALLAQPQAGWVVTNHIWGKTGTQAIERAGTHQWPQVDDNSFLLTLMRGCFITLQGALVRTACYAQVGPFRDELINSQDYDMMLRLAAAFPAVLLDQPSFIFRQHEGLRGSAARRYHGRDREKNFASYDRVIGRTLRDTLMLGMYLEPPLRSAQLDNAQQRHALLNRMTVMASKSLVSEVLEDALLLAAAMQSNTALTSAEQRTAVRVTQQRYFVLSLLNDPRGFLEGCTQLAQTKAGRSLLQQFGRGLAGVARWGSDSWRQRLRLAGLGARLMFPRLSFGFAS